MRLDKKGCVKKYGISNNSYHKKATTAYIVRAEDWLNPRMYVIDAQDPYTADTKVIYKSDYKVGWILDENGEANHSF